MGKFKFTATQFKGLYLVEADVHNDNRGSFMEIYNQEAFRRAGISISFVQDNRSISRRGVLRGLHYQQNNPQAKLVRVVSGQIFDVAVDLRPDSGTYQQWYAVILSSENPIQIFIPAGFAHGFLVLSARAEVQYKCSAGYDPNDERGICWNDPRININWPLNAGEMPILSPKDTRWPWL